VQSKLVERWAIRLFSRVRMSWPGSVTIFCLVLALTNALPAQCARRHQPDQAPAVVAVIYDYANVPGKTLDRARFEATRILAIAGIKIHWIVLPISAKVILNVSELSPPVGVVKLNLKILPRSMAVRLAPHGKCLGFALLPHSGTGGNTAYVFYDRVRRLVRSAGMPVGPVLGSVMSHEIGHLLLASRSHSARGIMRGLWDHRVLQSALEDQLEFTQAQSEQMRAEILTRLDSSVASMQETRQIARVVDHQD
jgi:hypothetical protein